MKIHFVVLWSDIFVYVLFFTGIIFAIWTHSVAHWREVWVRISSRKLAMISLVFLISYSLVALLDSVHFKRVLFNDQPYSSSLQIESILDLLLAPLGRQDEDSYSAPFSLYSSARTTLITNGKVQSYYPRLKYSGRHLKSTRSYRTDIFGKVMNSFLIGLGLSFIGTLLLLVIFAKMHKERVGFVIKKVVKGNTTIAWREILLASAGVLIIICMIAYISPYYHILGTDKIGTDTLYETIKSIRTGLIIGTLTTLVMLPFAMLLGAFAGYFGGWRDDVVQYIYTTLSSIPSVLLISASVLSLQIFISNHTELFPNLESRADLRLLALCGILGITSWTSLCRLLRAETLKLREMDYIKAAITMGVSSVKIILRHILPNVMHIILITVIIDFSALVLAEAVLSYVGVGVDPTTPSWGNMINSARLDLAREPIVWWPLFAAFIFMFILVLSANLFADALRDGLDPRLRNEE